MKVQIVDTSDGQYLGKIVNITSSTKQVQLDDDVTVVIEKQIELPDGIRLVNSNYIIDTRKV